MLPQVRVPLPTRPRLLQESTPPELRAIFTIEAQSPALCLLLQVDKPVSEETSNGVKGVVYTRREPVREQAGTESPLRRLRR